MTKMKMKTDVVVVGAGGCGLTAALIAAEQGKRVLLIERDSTPGGSTAMSAGIFVAARSRLQKANNMSGTAEELAADILAQNGRESDVAVTHALCAASGPLMDWLVAKGVPLEHMPDYVYSGMSQSWLHSPPSRNGAVIVAALMDAVERQPAIQLLAQTRATGLLTSDDKVIGLTARQVSGQDVLVGAQAVILGASGFGANASLVAHYIPEFSGAPYYGAPYATGDAIQWGQALGAAVDHMRAYQSHSSIAYPQRMLVTTYLINHGAIQVNQHGRRFGDETDSYSRHALDVQAQSGEFVIELFDKQTMELALANYPRFRQCLDAGIVMEGQSLRELAEQFDIDADALAATVRHYNELPSGAEDEFGRVRSGMPLTAPYYGIKVTSALVQTLGGLKVNERAQVLRIDGEPIAGLYAGGGTACGLAGERPEGYLAGTGLLAAFGLGWIAGHEAARTLNQQV